VNAVFQQVGEELGQPWATSKDEVHSTDAQTATRGQRVQSRFYGWAG
jgi:hypothetical protein